MTTARAKEEAKSGEARSTDHPTRLHAWLHRHQVIFLTAAATILSIASVIVGYLQWDTARQQATITLRKEQPNFVVTANQIWNSDESRVTDEELHIQNFGGPAHELQHQAITFLNVSATKGPDKRNILIPVNGFYTACGITADSVSGLLVRCRGYRNDEKLFGLEKSFWEMAKGKGYDAVELDTVRYVGLSYDDLFDKHHSIYLQVEPIKGARQISTTEGRRLVEEFWANFYRDGGVEFGSLTAEKVYERLGTPRSPQ